MTENLQMGRKHCGKRRNCSLRAISSFPTVFSKVLYCRHAKDGACLEKRLTTVCSGPARWHSGERVGCCEFDSRLRRTSFPTYFRLSPLQQHVRKVVGGFGKKSCVGTGVRKPGNMCFTDRHDMTLAVKVA